MVDGLFKASTDITNASPSKIKLMRLRTGSWNSTITSRSLQRMYCQRLMLLSGGRCVVHLSLLSYVRFMLRSTLPSLTSPLITFLLRPPQFPVNAYFQLANRLLSTIVCTLITRSSNSSRCSSLHVVIPIPPSSGSYATPWTAMSPPHGELHLTLLTSHLSSPFRDFSFIPPAHPDPTILKFLMIHCRLPHHQVMVPSFDSSCLDIR